MLNLSTIRIDGGTQPRAKIDESVVAEYAVAMRGGATFPPVVVFKDGVDIWLADGFHRFHAARSAGLEQLATESHTGTLRDAILYSVAANATHGTRRTNEDKRRAVLIVLNDPEWSQWSDREIGRRCSVDPGFVGDMRKKSSLSLNHSERKITTKHGTQTTMNTQHIGKRDTGQINAQGRRIVLPAGQMTAAERGAQISELAAQGNRAAQIGKIIGMTEKSVRSVASEQRIVLPDKTFQSQRINSRKVIEQTVASLEASAQSLHTIKFTFDDITPAEALEWSESVAESLKIYRHFHKQLIEKANG